jgi:hypothetical protein
MEELKDLVLQSLDTNGTLDAIRAQLRSNVFKVIAGQKPIDRSEAAKIASHEFGLLAVDLFAEFLSQHEFGNTLSVFYQEAQVQERSPAQVQSKFQLKQQPGKTLLAQVLHKANELPTPPKKPEARVVKGEPIAEIPAFRPQKREEKPQKQADDFEFWGSEPKKSSSPLEEVKKNAELQKAPPIKEVKPDPFKGLTLEPFKEDKPETGRPKLEPVREKPKLEPITDKPKTEPVKEQPKPAPVKEQPKPEPVKEKPKLLDPISTKHGGKESKPEPLPPLFSRSKPGLLLPSFDDESNEGEKQRLAKFEKDLAAIEAKEKAGKVVDIQPTDEYSEEFDE